MADMGRLLRAGGVLVVVVAIVVAAAGGAYYSGAIAQPTAGIEDYGDWGEITDERTEVVTTFWVDNPNAVGMTVDSDVSASSRLYLNGVNLAHGEKGGISIEPGNNTVPISTSIRNDELAPFWAAFVNDDETIHLRAESSATVDAGPLATTVDLPTQRKTLLADETPVINALSQSAAAAEGTYTASMTVDQGPVEETTVVGYEVQRGWASWGTVDERTTTVLFHFRVHNPSETVAVPAVPDGLGMSVDMNDVRLFRAQGDELSPRNVDGDSVIPPGETRTVVLEVQMDNSKVDEWFTSHVRNDERTEIATQLQLVYNVDGHTFRLPEDGPKYRCELRTAILVDDRGSSTTCLEPESIPGGQTAADGSDEGSSSSDGTTTPTTETPPPSQPTDERPTPTAESEPPTAILSANQTSGEAPLTVAFDASESTDPNGDIERYIWRFKDGTAPREGEAVTHTFRTAGEYEVELVVVDADGNRDAETVTITVDPRGL